MLEADRNIRAKLPSSARFRFHRLLTETPLVLSPVPSPTARRRFSALAAEDDHVVAACIVSGAEYLITLDRKLIARLEQAALPFSSMQPGDFFKQVLVHHADYPTLRE